MRPLLAFVFTVLLVLSVPSNAKAWIFPEHRDIANAALAKLPAESRAALDRLWAEARACYAAPLCESITASDQSDTPRCVDFGSWPALAGDHSCSPKDLAESVLPGDWVLSVGAVAAQTKAELTAATSREEKLNVLASSNLRLQSADAEYASRATSNIAHFLLPRGTDDVVKYMQSAFAVGAPLNALGIYVQQHLAALAAAQRFATTPPSDPKQRAELARKVLALEAYALHWLEDVFAAGHVVGTWGETAWRKGTHDYYNEFGFSGRRWNGEPIVLFGDANLKAADLANAAAVVAQSLEQLSQALVPGDALGVASTGFGLGPEGAYAFDACNTLVQPRSVGGNRAVIVAAMKGLLLATPIPGRGQGDVHLPRFRQELGPFVGIFGAISGGVTWGGLVAPTARGSASLAAGLRLGFGAESLTGTPGTATAFLEGGLQMSAAEAASCHGEGCDLVGTSNLFPAAPGRTGLRVGLRLPFWLLPGDTLLLVPVLALVAPRALNDVGVAAASGGLIPYERTFQTGAGSFQLVVGREAQATFFGYLGPANLPLFIAPIGKEADGTNRYGVISERSMALAFPVLEWTPFREFATQLTFTALLQLGFGVEVPLKTNVVYPEGSQSVDVPPSWSVFLRGQFDGRYFLGSREDLQPPRF